MMGSTIWRLTFITGSSDDIGSWNTVPTSRPRIAFSARSDRPVRSRPSSRT